MLSSRIAKLFVGVALGLLSSGRVEGATFNAELRESLDRLEKLVHVPHQPKTTFFVDSNEKPGPFADLSQHLHAMMNFDTPLFREHPPLRAQWYELIDRTIDTVENAPPSDPVDRATHRRMYEVRDALARVGRAELEPTAAFRLVEELLWLVREAIMDGESWARQDFVLALRAHLIKFERLDDDQRDLLRAFDKQMIHHVNQVAKTVFPEEWYRLNGVVEAQRNRMLGPVVYCAHALTEP